MLSRTAASGGNTFAVWRSQDGALTAQKVGYVTANSSLIETDSEAGMQFFFYENGAGVYVQTSRDGGETYDDPVACQYNSAPLQATLLSSRYNARGGAKMVLECVLSGNTVLLESLTKGIDWTLKQTF